MKKYVKLTTLLLVFATMLSLFAACANTGGEDTTAPSGAQTQAPTESGAATEEVTLYVPDDLNETYNFGETYAYVQFMPGYMESHLKTLKQYKIYCTVMFPKEARTLKKQIANLEAVLKQEPVISKIPHSSY